MILSKSKKHLPNHIQLYCFEPTESRLQRGEVPSLIRLLSFKMGEKEINERREKRRLESAAKPQELLFFLLSRIGTGGTTLKKRVLFFVDVRSLLSLSGTPTLRHPLTAELLLLETRQVSLWFCVR